MTIKFPFSRFKISGHSMLPTLKPGQEIISFNWAYLFSKQKVGDIIVFKKAGKLMVKRIHTLDDHLIYVQGDNKDDSTDSRKFGWLSNKDILGKAIYTSHDSNQ